MRLIGGSTPPLPTNFFINLNFITMSKISETNRELLDTMNGCEVISISYEGCVWIKQDRVIKDGKQVDTLNTNAKIKSLWDEYFEGEGGNYLLY